MHRDHQQQAGFKTQRDHAREEWGRTGADPHQSEAREHARMPGRTQRARAVREAEAERQIRELRSRY